MVTREAATEQLKSLGVKSPTDDQITAYLNNINAEAVKEKAKADKYKTDADKSAELQKKLEEIEQNGLSDMEKANKANEMLQNQIKELQSSSYRSEAKAILKGANLADEDIETILIGVVAGAEKIEDVQSRANAYVSLIKKSSESAVKEYTKAALDSTHVPGGEAPKPDDKSEAVKLAEQMASTRSDSIKTAQTSLDYYGGTNK